MKLQFTSRNDRKVREIVEKHRGIYEALPIAASLWGQSADGNLMLLDCNDAIAKFFGTKDKEEAIESYDKFIPEFQKDGTRSKERCIQLLQYVFETGETISTPWLHVIRGEDAPISITLKRLLLDGYYFILVYALDLRPLHTLAQESRIMIDASPMAITLYDKNLNTIECNPEAYKMFGLINNLSFTKMVTTMPLLQPNGENSMQVFTTLVEQTKQSGKAHAELICQKFDGTLFPADITWARVKYKGDDAIIEYVIDITEKKAAIEAERNANELYRAYSETSPILIEVWDENLNMIDCNLQVMDLFGVASREEYIKIFPQIAPEFQPCGTPSMEKSDALIKQTFNEGRAYSEWIHLDKNGNHLPVECTFVRINRNGENAVIVYSHDLRTVKAAQQKEREALDLANAIFDSAPLVIDLWDENINLVSTSEYAVELFGLSSKEEYIREFPILSPEFQPDGARSATTALANVKRAFEIGRDQFKWMRITKSGELISTEVMLVRIEHAGHPMVIAFCIDLRPIETAMQKERELEQQLREWELTERIRLMFDAAPLIIEYWDTNHNIIDCNQSALDFFGFETKEAYCAPPTDTEVEKQPDGSKTTESRFEKLEEIFNTGRASFEFAEKKLTGEEVYLEVEGVRIKDGDKILAITFSKDITQLRQLQAEQQRIEVAEESSRAKSRFLARMSHEIRTPITAVLGISEIQLQSGTLTPIVEESFAKVHDSANVLLEIVNDILDLSKIEAGKMSLLCEEYDISSLISDAVQPHIVHLGYKDIDFRVNIDPNLPRLMVGDSLRVKQIMNNLLSNAFKYTESGAVSMSMERKPSDKQDFLNLEICIRDTGLGMTKEQLKILSLDYSRFHEKQSRHVVGTGLGMSIVYNLVELMGAQIEVASEVDVGTTVTVQIPQKIITPEPLGKAMSERLQRFEVTVGSQGKKFNFVPEPMPYGSVLVVDDVDANLYVAHGLLTFYDLNIETCTSGYTALDKVKFGKKYDIIFMDQMMPGMDGTETMHAIRDTGYQGVIVALTANALIGQAEELIGNGFDGFISKPIQTPHLNAILNKHIRDKQPNEVLEAAAIARAAKNYNLQQTNLNTYQENPQLMKKLKTDFVKRHKSTYDEITQLIRSGEIKAAHILAHSLKGTAGLIRESELVKAALQVEIALAKKEVPTDKQLTSLKQALLNTFENIDTVKEDTPHTLLPNKETVEALFNKLDPLLKSKKVESLELLDELRKIPETAILVRQIEEYDFSLAAQNLSTLRSILLA